MRSALKELDEMRLDQNLEKGRALVIKCVEVRASMTGFLYKKQFCGMTVDSMDLTFLAHAAHEETQELLRLTELDEASQQELSTKWQEVTMRAPTRSVATLKTCPPVAGFSEKQKREQILICYSFPCPRPHPEAPQKPPQAVMAHKALAPADAAAGIKQQHLLRILFIPSKHCWHYKISCKDMFDLLNFERINSALRVWALSGAQQLHRSGWLNYSTVTRKGVNAVATSGKSCSRNRRRHRATSNWHLKSQITGVQMTPPFPYSLPLSKPCMLLLKAEHTPTFSKYRWRTEDKRKQKELSARKWNFLCLSTDLKACYWHTTYRAESNAVKAATGEASARWAAVGGQQVREACIHLYPSFLKMHIPAIMTTK
eukprot:1161139-Pelagomonas_calceolata.AAC.5